MKFFVVLLAVGLSASETLNSVYLPSPGAKLAGGRFEDLQTPLKYPKETSIFGPENSEKAHVESEIQRSELQSDIFKTVNSNVKTGTPGDEEMLINIPAHLNSGFKISVIPMGFGLESTVENSQNGSPNLKYPFNGKYSEKKGIFDQWNSRDHFGETGYNMPIIPIPKDIIKEYKPKAFGMYGGYPMIIKSYSERSQNLQPVIYFGNYNEIHLNHTSDDISTSDESFRSNSQKTVMYDASRTSSKQNLRILPEVTQNIALTPRPDKQKAQKYSQEKKERQPQALERTATILNYKNVLTPEGFVNSFDTSNGIHKDESASTLDGVKAQGSYSFTGDDGKVYSITYTADENGFQPKGVHLPTPPPIPEAIQKVIEQANRDKETGISHDGSYDEQRYGHMKYQGPINRYLHNIQKSLKVGNRKRVQNRAGGKPRKMKKSFSMKDVLKLYEIKHEKNAQQSYVTGQYGIKRGQSVQINEGNLIKSQNGENSSRRRIPIVEVDNFKQGLRKSSVPTFYIKAKNITVSTNQPQRISSASNRKYKGSNNYQIIGHLNSMTNNQVATKSKFVANEKLQMTVSENGYYYVPPRNMFIEEKFQNKPTLEGFLGQNGNLDIKSVPVTGFYNIGRNKNKKKFPEKLSTKITSYFTTEEPLNMQTHGSDFSEITNHEVEQSIKDERTTTEITSNENIVIVTTEQPYEISLGTNPSDQAYEGIDYQEDTVISENRVENGVPSTRNNPNTANYLSTTPMPSSSATNYVENEGYYQTIPAISETLEEILTSTYKPIYTVDEFQTEQTLNIKVDGFGRSIQDTPSFNTKSPGTDGYYTNNLFNDEFRTNGEITSTASHSNKYEKDFKNDTAAAFEDRQSNSSVILSENFDSEEGSATHKYSGNKKVTSVDRTIENDFSGPKQPQSYDRIFLLSITK